MNPHKKTAYCLVLGGGGAKGVYHGGVWRALSELKIPVDAFVGNSVGALMAAMLAQGDYKELEEITDTIEIGSILNVPDELVENGRVKLSAVRLPFFRVFTRDVLKHRGIDTAPLRRLIETHVNEKKLRHLGVDFGVQTFNLSDMRPGGKFIDEIGNGELVEYLLASSAVPGFISPIIHGKKYVDGGVYDNVPYSMARKRGYRRIIAVDLDGTGVTRRPDIRGSETVLIRCSIPLGGILDFNRQTLADLKRLGYLDTMRAFGKYNGYRYFIEQDDAAEASFLEFLQSEAGDLYTTGFLESHGHRDTNTGATAVRQLFPREVRFERHLFATLLDCAAHFLDIPQIRAYSYEEIQEVIREKQRVIDDAIQETLENGDNSITSRVSRGIESLVKSAPKRDEHEHPPYYYFRIVDYLLREPAKSVLKERVSGFFPNAQAAEFLLDQPVQVGTYPE